MRYPKRFYLFHVTDIIVNNNNKQQFKHDKIIFQFRNSVLDNLKWQIEWRFTKNTHSHTSDSSKNLILELDKK